MVVAGITTVIAVPFNILLYWERPVDFLQALPVPEHASVDGRIQHTMM